jgi:hypothetical protein
MVVEGLQYGTNCLPQIPVLERSEVREQLHATDFNSPTPLDSGGKASSLSRRLYRIDHPRNGSSLIATASNLCVGVKSRYHLRYRRKNEQEMQASRAHPLGLLSALIDTPPSSSLLPQPTTPLLNPINAHKTHIKISPHPSLLSSCTRPLDPQKCILTYLQYNCSPTRPNKRRSANTTA